MMLDYEIYQDAYEIMCEGLKDIENEMFMEASATIESNCQVIDNKGNEVEVIS